MRERRSHTRFAHESRARRARGASGRAPHPLVVRGAAAHVETPAGQSGRGSACTRCQTGAPRAAGARERLTDGREGHAGWLGGARRQLSCAEECVRGRALPSPHSCLSTPGRLFSVGQSRPSPLGPTRIDPGKRRLPSSVAPLASLIDPHRSGTLGSCNFGTCAVRSRCNLNAISVRGADSEVNIRDLYESRESL